MAGNPKIFQSSIRNVEFGESVKLVEPSNLYECKIGDRSFVGPFVEIQKGVEIGSDCKIQSHSFICELVTIGNHCFIGHGVMFINDKFADGGPAGGDQTKWDKTNVGNHVNIGSNATILPVSICDHVVIGAGAVVTKDITSPGVYIGNPRQKIKSIMKIPFLDLKAQYLGMKEEIDQAVKAILENTSFIGGPLVNQFEKQFAEYIGAEFAIGCANGTDALEIALKALGVGPGDEVIVPAMSWISTSEAVSTVGATPVFCDIDPDYYTIAPERIEALITKNTKVIIPVHLYGAPADMPSIMKIARSHGLKVLEDCAQSHGAKIDKQTVGTFGDIATFSFYPGKNLGAYGDAGAIVTNSEKLADFCRMYSNHGQITKHHHVMEGRNSRLDTLNASILTVKLKYIDQWNQARRNAADQYLLHLQKLPQLKLPQTIDHGSPVYHVFAISTKERDQLKAFLQEKGIATQIHYPYAMPVMPAYAHRQLDLVDYENAISLGDEELSLPIYPEITDNQIQYVCNCIIEFFNKI